ncbi:hypothetical protein DPMN_085254 [Dreissena polymorpha]|uniref:Uncharacterized protein n=1 Tax=Dreissena polymorpha TaxID=45954 RepID=A0A9D3YGJ2_DREPO|nr:hypothetical protein DPMN_085254 [Dreissena polymorpha]
MPKKLPMAPTGHPAFLIGEQDKSDLHLAHLAAAYRSPPHEITKLFLNLPELRGYAAILIYGHAKSRPCLEKSVEYLMAA